MDNYLQTAWGDSFDNVDLLQIKEAIRDIQTMDDEHGAFWVGVLSGNQEIVLEVDKGLSITGVFGETKEDQIRKQAANWDEVESLYGLLLNGEVFKLKALLE